MTKLYRTFKDSAEQYISENLIHKVEVKEPLKAFAKWLDGFQVANADLQIVALQQARKIDRELINGLIDIVGLDKARTVITNVSNRHRHYSQWQDRQNKGGAQSSRIARSWLTKKATALAWLTWHLGKLSPRLRILGLTPASPNLPQKMQDDLKSVK